MKYVCIVDIRLFERKLFILLIMLYVPLEKDIPTYVRTYVCCIEDIYVRSYVYT